MFKDVQSTRSCSQLSPLFCLQSHHSTFCLYSLVPTRNKEGHGTGHKEQKGQRGQKGQTRSNKSGKGMVSALAMSLLGVSHGGLGLRSPQPSVRSRNGASHFHPGPFKAVLLSLVDAARVPPCRSRCCEDRNFHNRNSVSGDHQMRWVWKGSAK